MNILPLLNIELMPFDVRASQRLICVLFCSKPYFQSWQQFNEET